MPYEAELHGKPGFREILVNAAGRPVEGWGSTRPQLHSRSPVAGEDLVLGIGLRVQKVAEAALTGKRGVGGGARSEDRRHHRARKYTGVRPQRLRQGIDR